MESDELNKNNVNPELDLEYLYNSIKRNIKFITKTTFAGLAIGAIFAFTLPKTWKGEFQIVLDNEEKTPLTQFNSNLAQLAGFSQKENLLSTQVEILKSSSVLVDVFEYVKSKKLENNEKYNNFKFSTWLDQLEIKLIDDTSVLNLSYKDKQKKIIIPVLKKISNSYQEYSGKKRLRDIELGLEYFKNQKYLYEKKTINAMKIAQNFAIEHDLMFLTETSNTNDVVAPKITIEEERVNASNRIRLIDNYLEKLNSINNSDEILYFASTIKNFIKDENETVQKLKNIDERLILLRKKFKENDKSVLKNRETRETLIKLLKKQIIGSLNAQRIKSESLLKSSERPKGVLIQYRQLINNYYKNKNTLENLEKQYIAVSLENSRREDPWELITEPTLLPEPIFPLKKQFFAIGILGGLILGAISSFVSERNKGILFSINELTNLYKFPVIEIFSLDSENDWNKSYELVGSGVISKFTEGTALIELGMLEEKYSNLIFNGIKKYIKNKSFLKTDPFKEEENITNIILLIRLGKTTKKEVEECNRRLLTTNKKIKGFLIIC